MNTVHCLSTLPAGDGNFASALKRATEDELRTAISNMQESGGNHKGRISACQRELRKKMKGQE